MKAPNGRTYRGDFKDGLKSGEGTLNYNNGDFYTGQWAMDKPNGFGIFVSQTEGTYTGTFVNGLRDGSGRMIYTNGDLYDGGWRRDLFHDKGSLICANGGMDRYDGRWENGKKCGKGICIYRGLGKLEGEFKDDKVS